MKKLISLVLLMGFVFIAFPSLVLGQPIEIKVASVLPQGHCLVDACFKFKEEIEKLSGGKIVVKVFPSGQLGSGRELIEGVQMGSIQMCEHSLAPLSGFSKTFLVFNLPYLFKTREIAYEFLDSPIGEEMKRLVEKDGILVLSFWENGYRHVTNSKRPIKTPADLKGLKIRTMENPVHMEAFRQMGALPTPMAFGEVFTALQQGVIDGQENSYSNMYVMKFHEVQKYITDTSHFYDVTGFMINPKFFYSLSPDLQEAVKKAAKTATTFQRERAITDDDKFRKLVAEKLQFTELTPEERAKFAEASKGTYDVFKKEIGEENLNKILNELKKIEEARSKK
ncbi:MAG: TRAP transporter substrate-binding protein [Synergistetes bacterium]|nr:TRAP transporter substrate-binding protein [Synergistota bacterium]MDW8191653.1 TRAP transporter substrate-binding protein [Synergistota bacterium]